MANVQAPDRDRPPTGPGLWNRLKVAGRRQAVPDGRWARVAGYVARAAVLLSVACVVAGVALRLSVLDRGSLWLDELWTVDAISRSYKEMVGARLVSDQSPPLWTSLAWAWLRLVGGYDATALRALPLIVSTAASAVPLVAAVRWRALRAPFVVMAALLALSTISVEFGVEFRNYALMMALVTVATVLWAGLLTDQLVGSGRWILLFALVGSLAGFAHYYGNFTYAGLAAVLLGRWALARRWREAAVLSAWVVLSFVPVVGWYFGTRRWSPGVPVAGEPSFAEVKTWAQFTFGPMTNVFAGQPPGYAVGTPGTGIWIGAVALVLLAATLAVARVRRGTSDAGAPSVGLVGLSSFLVVAFVVACAWVASLVLPPSMNAKNLLAAGPPVFLATACAVTASRHQLVRWAGAALAIALWCAANGLFVAEYGVQANEPPWHSSSGYRGAARLLVASQQADRPPHLVGIEQPWLWHGDWDAIIRTEQHADPADSADPAPLPVTWLASPDATTLAAVPAGPVIVFASTGDPRGDALMAWAAHTHGPCRSTTFGSAGYGNVTLARCG